MDFDLELLEYWKNKYKHIINYEELEDKIPKDLQDKNRRIVDIAFDSWVRKRQFIQPSIQKY